MTFPILEYDSTRIAFIEPSKVIKPLDMPNRAQCKGIGNRLLGGWTSSHL